MMQMEILRVSLIKMKVVRRSVQNHMIKMEILRMSMFMMEMVIHSTQNHIRRMVHIEKIVTMKMVM